MARCELCDYSPDCESIYNDSLLARDQAGGEPRFRPDYNMCLCRGCYQDIMKSNLYMKEYFIIDEFSYETVSPEGLEGILQDLDIEQQGGE